MRISDWSSDVCSSDLQREALEALIEKTTTMDVLDYLDDLPNGCAQLVCTSVPYNIGKPYQDGASADSMRHVYYIGWLMQIVSEASRTIGSLSGRARVWR